MTVSFDTLTETVSITCLHPVDDGRTHYIEAVQVEVDGSFHQLYTIYNDRQWDAIYFNTTVTNVKAEKGDVLTVTLTCNQGGTIERTLTVGGSSVPDPPTGTDPPVPEDPQLPPGVGDPGPTDDPPVDDAEGGVDFVYLAIAIVIIALVLTVLLGMFVAARTRLRRGRWE